MMTALYAAYRNSTVYLIKFWPLLCFAVMQVHQMAQVMKLVVTFHFILA